MSEPIILKQVGSRWEVHVNMDAARRRALRKSAPLFKRFPDASHLVVVKEGKKIDLKEHGTPARLSKSEADGLAHQIGYYGLDLGSFVHTYTKIEREASRDSYLPRRPSSRDARLLRKASRRRRRHRRLVR
jgi:hypothetical protein